MLCGHHSIPPHKHGVHCAWHCPVTPTSRPSSLPAITVAVSLSPPLLAVTSPSPLPPHPLPFATCTPPYSWALPFLQARWGLMRTLAALRWTRSSCIVVQAIRSNCQHLCTTGSLRGLRRPSTNHLSRIEPTGGRLVQGGHVPHLAVRSRLAPAVGRLCSSPRRTCRPRTGRPTCSTTTSATT